MSDEEKRPPDNVKRVGPKDRKDRLDYGKRLFPPETPLPLDPPTPDDSGEPLPFDEAALGEERFPPLPFDGDDLVVSAQAEEEERFPPLPTPGWARPAPPPAASPRPSAPPGPRKKIRPTVQRQPAPEKRGRGCFYNLMTLLFIVLTIGAIAFGVYIFNNPYSSLNPLPPPTPLPIVITATFLPPEPTVAATEAPVIGPALTDEPATQAPTAEVTDEPIAGPRATFTPLPADLLTELAPPTQEGVG